MTPTPRPMLNLIREHPAWVALLVIEVCALAILALSVAQAKPLPDAREWPEDAPPQRCKGVRSDPAPFRDTYPAESGRKPISASTGHPTRRVLTLHADSDHDAAEALIRAVGGWREAA